MWHAWEKGEVVYSVSVGRPEGKRPLGRHRCRWEVNIKLDLREIGINGVNWIQLGQEGVQWQAFVNMVMNLLSSIKEGYFLICCDN